MLGSLDRRFAALQAGICGRRRLSQSICPTISAGVSTAATNAAPIPAAVTYQDNEFIQTALQAGVYGFHLGQPGPDLIPVQKIKEALNCVIDESADPLMLQYRQPVDFLSVRENLAAMLSAQHGISVSADCLAITPGNSAALGMIFSNVALRRTRSSVDAHPYTAVVENPTYFLAGQMFADAGIETIPVAMDENGLDVDAVVDMCRRGSVPDFVYTITNFHNPTGRSLSAPRREQLLELAEEYDFLVVADEPYNLLVFGDEPPPLPLIASGSGHASKRVVCLGSFSKLLAPGLRLGWMHASPELIGAQCYLYCTIQHAAPSRLLTVLVLYLGADRAWRNVGVLDSGGGLNPLGAFSYAAWSACCDLGNCLNPHLRRSDVVLLFQAP